MTNQTFEALLQALQSTNSKIQFDAARALYGLGDPRALDPLLAIINHQTGWLRPTGPAGRYSDDPYDGLRIEAASALGAIKDGRAAQALSQALLRSDNDSFRYAAVEALGEIRDKVAIEPLLSVFKASRGNEIMRRRAVEALLKINDHKAFGVFIVALQDSDYDVRNHAAKGLAQLKDAKAVGPLISALRAELKAGLYNRRYSTDSKMLRALLSFGDAALPSLIALGKELIINDNHDVRLRAIQFLEELYGAPGPSPSPPIAGAAATSLLQELRSPQIVELLRTALSDKNFYVHGHAAVLLGRLGNAEGVPFLVEVTGDKSSARWAVWNLEVVLQTTLAQVPIDVLQRIACLANVVESVGGHDEAYREDPVDCSKVNELARQELLRRGDKVLDQLPVAPAGIVVTCGVGASNSDFTMPLAPAAIVVTCECGKRLRTKLENAGRRVLCPHCGAVLTVPGS